ncbi:LacI family DNA-binding transcriptional regulator [Oryzibacter oryziterrae]|uniref:LacI family DNA-binding transcriptional regulator n=1 Tax=Oryzibacter oryziterrae TaxID=2766474 RepID=UPI001F43279F|nr:LacI family DNA-binding transcriptional regulator [Oryzibacter oryziterrae]
MATLKTIAKAVGVSSTTVSRVLNSDQTLSISEQKRRAIIEAAAAMNYAPPRVRNSGGRNALKRIALVHFLRPEHELIDPYYVSVRLGIESRCQTLKMETVRVYADTMPEPALLENAAGVIAIGSFEPDYVDWLQRYGRQLVFADSIPPGEEFDAVASDLAVAMRKLLTALGTKGYRRIGFAGWIGQSETDPYGEVRCRTYASWMAEHGGFDPALCATEQSPDHNSEALGYRMAERLMAQSPRPDAIITCNDNVAIGVYRYLQEKSIAIPGDVAVASFNDIPTAPFLNPPLTTVRLPAEQIGEVAVDLLLERLAGRTLVKQITLASQIVWRGSV